MAVEAGPVVDPAAAQPLRLLASRAVAFPAVAVGPEGREEQVEEERVLPAEKERVLLDRHGAVLDHVVERLRPREGRVLRLAREEERARLLRDPAVLGTLRHLLVRHGEAPLA